MVIFDLDNTLFNTSLLKEDFKKVFERYNLRGQKFWQSFYQAYNIDPKTNGCYSIDKHLEVLKDWEQETKQKVKKDLKKIMFQRGQDYLYPEVLSILEKLKNNKVKIILITKGDKNFQKVKIKITGIKPYFERVYIIEGDKLPILEEVVKRDDNIIDINDHIEELRFMRENFPQVNCIFLRRCNQVEPNGLGIPSVSNLNEISSHLRTLQFQSP